MTFYFRDISFLPAKRAMIRYYSEEEENVSEEEIGDGYTVEGEAGIFCEVFKEDQRLKIAKIAIEAFEEEADEWDELLFGGLLKELIKDESVMGSGLKRLKAGPKAIKLNQLFKRYSCDIGMEDYEDGKIYLAYAMLFPIIFATNFFDVLANTEKKEIKEILTKNKENERMVKIFMETFEIKDIEDLDKIKGFPIKLTDYATKENIKKYYKNLIVSLWNHYIGEDLYQRIKNFAIMQNKESEKENKQKNENKNIQKRKVLAKLGNEIAKRLEEMLDDFVPFMIKPDLDNITKEDFFNDFSIAIYAIHDIFNSLGEEGKHCLDRLKNSLKIFKRFGKKYIEDFISEKNKMEVNYNFNKLNDLSFKIINIDEIFDGEDYALLDALGMDYDADTYEVVEELLMRLKGKESNNKGYKNVIEIVINWMLEHDAVHFMPIILKVRKDMLRKDMHRNVENERVVEKAASRHYDKVVAVEKEEKEPINIKGGTKVLEGEKQKKKNDSKQKEELEDKMLGFIVCGTKAAYLTKEGFYKIAKLIYLDTICLPKDKIESSIKVIEEITDEAVEKKAEGEDFVIFEVKPKK
jgi:hypothetical protein